MTANPIDNKIPSVPDAEAALAAINARIAEHEAEAEGGDDLAPARLNLALRERQRAVEELALARQAARTAAVVAAARDRRQAEVDAKEVRAQLDARRLPAAKMAAKVAALRLELEAREGELIRYLNEEAHLWARLDALVQKAGTRRTHVPTHTAEFRLALLVEIERRRLAPGAPLTDDGRMLRDVRTPSPLADAEEEVAP